MGRVMCILDKIGGMSAVDKMNSTIEIKWNKYCDIVI